MMGQRLRLKSSYVISTNWSKQEQSVLRGLKKYGALVADNGNFFSISVTPDDRWPAGCFDNLSFVSITNFEVVAATGPTEGPRSSGAPVAFAGPDQSVSVGVPVQLPGAVTYSNTPTILWKLYSGPAGITLVNASQTNATATFNAPGVYTLLLSADDGTHAVAYDAAVFTVGAPGIVLNAAPAGTNVNLSWTGGTPPFVIERTPALGPPTWSAQATTSVQAISFPATNFSGFFRVRGN